MTTGAAFCWQGGPRNRHSMNRHPPRPASNIPITVKISSFFIPGISHRNGNVPQVNPFAKETLHQD